jgi:hypothetical protein
VVQQSPLSKKDDAQEVALVPRGDRARSTAAVRQGFERRVSRWASSCRTPLDSACMAARQFTCRAADPQVVDHIATQIQQRIRAAPCAVELDNSNDNLAMRV